MALFSKRQDDTFRRYTKDIMVEQMDNINYNRSTFPHDKFVEIGPNIFIFLTGGGTYFYVENGHVEGALYCSNYRDVIEVGLSVRHAEAIKATVFHDAIENKGIFPLQTLEDSILPELRHALGFQGPEKDEFTTAQRWVLRRWPSI